MKGWFNRRGLSVMVAVAILVGAVLSFGVVSHVPHALAVTPGEGPCAGLTLDAKTLAVLFAPASDSETEVNAKVTSDHSFLISFGGAEYNVKIDGDVAVYGGDPDSAARLRNDVASCIAQETTPAGGINTFGANGVYGVGASAPVTQ